MMDMRDDRRTRTARLPGFTVLHASAVSDRDDFASTLLTAPAGQEVHAR
jgi:hypothetical protein